ncbi:MAG: hypothetical protein HKP30_13780 [Myxococcales bacterium]|nr:hypothetical protein [Myxococcales bacterium]
MTDLNEKIQEELDELRGLRDDLKVQVHLGKLEAQERFEQAEKSWAHVEGKLKVLANESRESAESVGEALKLTLSEIRDAYRNLRELL